MDQAIMPISTINLHGEDYKIRDSVLDAIVSSNDNYYRDQLKQIWSKLNASVTLVHNCANCGAALHIEENKPVFHCKYCGSTYLIGTAQIYSNY